MTKLAVFALAVWLVGLLSFAGVWIASHWREIAVTRARSERRQGGRAYESGYLVLNSGRVYLLNGVRADPPRPGGESDEPYVSRWYWSQLQSNGWGIETVGYHADGRERREGVGWGGFAYRSDWANWRTGDRNRAVIVPCWSVAAALAVAPLPFVRPLLRRRRRGLGRCAQCGYDLRATPSRCPECGAEAATRPAA